MGKIIVNLPDDGWIDNCDEIKPGYGDLCLCISYYGKIPSFCQYRKADNMYKERDYFMSLDELFFLNAQGVEDDWIPTFMGPVEKWKPLGLPEASQKAVMKLIGRAVDGEGLSDGASM